MNIEFDCEEIRKWTFAKNGFSSTEEVFGYFEDGLHKKWALKESHWRNKQIFITRRRTRIWKKFYMKKFRLERRMWLKLFRNCPSLKNMDEPKSQKLQFFSATKMSLFWINGLTVILCFTKFFVCVWIIETVNTEHWLDISSIQGIEILINSRNSYLRTCFRSELGSV